MKFLKQEIDMNLIKIKLFIENGLNHPGQSTRVGAYLTTIPEYAEYFD